ncbi:MAG TPA: hypothetical protein VFT16_05345 [Candidatus Saccharimonadales bacterium]|nr:hypothetical protein [Candidatus Saccharimonadales bacterium]
MENQPNPLDPSHELPAGADDEIMRGSLYEQLQAAHEAQAAEADVRARHDAEIAAAYDEALRSPRLSEQERRLYRGIARAASVAELPEGTPAEDRRAAIPLFTNQVTAAENFARIREEAREKLRADRRDRRQEDRQRTQREAQEKAAQEAEERHQREAEEAQREAEESARKAKLEAEADRIRGKVRSTYPEDKKLEIIQQQVEHDLATKHAHVKGAARDMLRQGLHERYTQEANAHIEDAADKAAERRKAYINANGGADSLESIRAQEAAAEAQAAEEAKRQAFLDRLHNRGGNREAIVEYNSQRHSGRPETRPNNDSDQRADHISTEGVSGLSDEEIANLPAEVMEGMNDHARDAYFARLHRIVGGQPREWGNRELRGAYSFSGSTDELRDNLLSQTSAPEAPAAPDEPERRFSDLFELEEQDPEEWHRQFDGLSNEDREAYYAYGADRFAAIRPHGDPNWNGPTPVVPLPAVAPPARRLRPRRPFGGIDPNAPLPDRAPAAVMSIDPSDIVPQPPVIDNGKRTFGQLLADYWPGRSKVSHQPQTRPSVLRGIGRGLNKGAKWVAQNLAAGPRAEVAPDDDAYIREADRRAAEEANRPQPPVLPVVHRAAGGRPRRPAAAPRPNVLDDL